MKSYILKQGNALSYTNNTSQTKHIRILHIATILNRATDSDGKHSWAASRNGT